MANKSAKIDCAVRVDTKCDIIVKTQDCYSCPMFYCGRHVVCEHPLGPKGSSINKEGYDICENVHPQCPLKNGSITITILCKE